MLVMFMAAQPCDIGFVVIAWDRLLDWIGSERGAGFVTMGFPFQY